MSPVFLGSLLGITNVIVCAVLFSIVGSEPRAAGFVFVYGLLPGICTGAVLGGVAGRTRDRSWQQRLALIGIPAAGVVALLGSAFDVIAFVPSAILPTLACAALLEWHSRLHGRARVERDPDVVDLRPPRSAVRPAMKIAAVLMLVVLVGLSSSFHSQHPYCSHSHMMLPEVLGLYMPWGLGLALALAVPFGLLADCTRSQPVWLRRTALLTLGAILTAMLGSFGHMPNMIVMSFVPVAAGCLVLERSSRPAPLVPAAIAHR